MTDNNEIESLNAKLNSLYEIVNTNAEAKVSASKDAVLKEITSLYGELNQDFKPDDYKEASLESLQFNARVLRDTIKALEAKSESGDLAGLVTRGAIDELSAEQLEEHLIDLVQLGFGLEVADDEIKKLIQLERQVEGYTLRS